MLGELPSLIGLASVVWSPYRALPGREYVEKYIKAYYLPEQDMETWAKEHKVIEATPSHFDNINGPMMNREAQSVD